MRKAFRRLLESYEIYFVASSPNYDTALYEHVLSWLKMHIGVPAYYHVIFTPQPQLLLGDFFITPQEKSLLPAFMGTVVAFGSPTFKTWEDIATYFERMGAF